ncbi:MAG: hypothetical protein JWP30_1613 [Homoserinimonas sp.]|jgi:hypothetical protein|nr:hypothetical protein [Homoserinimonas sp.]
MIRLAVPLALIGLFVWVYTFIDCARTDEQRVRGLPKTLWIIIVILLPLIGSILWFAIGKGRKDRRLKPQSRPVYPDDDPAFLRKLGTDREQEERIRKLEEQLGELDDDNPKD